MNKKFFTRLGALFLVLIIIGFSEIFSSLLAMDSKEEDSLNTVPPKLLHLNRVDYDNEILLEYTDNLKLAGSNFIYNLKFPIDDELTNKVCQYGNKDGKSHVLVNSFDIYENKKKKFIEYEHLTTKAFHQVGIGANNTDIQIDWMSYQSNLQSTNEAIHRESTGIGNGHSEPQFITDIEKLFQTNSDAVVSLFTPRPNKLKNSKVNMCGLELYGYHDICDSCLNMLVAFREKHQEGEESISKAIEAKLKDKYSVLPDNSFAIIYHTLAPYAGSLHIASNYHTEQEGQHYIIKYLKDMAYVRNSKEPKSCTAFSVKNEEGNITALENTALIQANQLDIKKSIIYGQIHSLYSKKGTYQKPAWNDKYKFIFDGKFK